MHFLVFWLCDYEEQQLHNRPYGLSSLKQVLRKALYKTIIIYLEIYIFLSTSELLLSLG